MSTSPASPPKRPWTRPVLAETAPRRHFGGLYRTAEGEHRGESVGGVPLVDAEDAVTAAVRLGYKVVDTQIERGRRIARRLNGAAERAGIDDASVPLDAMERLITRAMLAGLGWIEGAAADKTGPMKRLAKAEYRLVGSLLGLLNRDAAEAGAGEPAVHRAPPVSPAAPVAAAVARGACRIKHKPGSQLRAVRVVDWCIEGNLSADAPYKLTFLQVADPALASLDADLISALGIEPVLEVLVLATHVPGRWRAAVCDKEQTQLGIVEIEI